MEYPAPTSATCACCFRLRSEECIDFTPMFFFSIIIFSGRRSGPFAKCHTLKKFEKRS